MRGVALLSLAALMGLGTVACGNKTAGDETAQGEATVQTDSLFNGIWKPIVDDPSSPDILFQDNGIAFFLIVQPDQKFALKAQYTVNATTEPMQVDIQIVGESIPLQGIAKFTGENEMLLDGADESNEPRPTHFSDKAVLFKRISRDTNLPDGIAIVPEETVE